MPRPLRLEDFGPATPSGAAPATALKSIDGERLEAERLEAFDKGYAAGWEDAVKATAQDREQAEAELASRLQELGFTFQEARAHVMQALRPLLRGVIERLLPTLWRDSLAAHLAETVEDLAEGAADTAIEIVAAPAEAPQIIARLERITALPALVIEEPSLEPGQFHLRLGARAEEIDLTAVEDEMRAALAALDRINEDSLNHG